MAQVEIQDLEIIAGALDKATDNLVKDVKGIVGTAVRIGDGPAYKILLIKLNKKFGNKIPDDLNPIIHQFAEAIKSENFAAVEKSLAKFLAAKVKTPFIDGTTQEVQTFDAVLTAIAQILRLDMSVKIAAPAK